MLLEGGRWELLVAIVLGFALTVAVGRVTSAALALINSDHARPTAVAFSPSAAR
jgi:hypothetical protein